MYGEITKFRRDLGLGVIRAEDGRKFLFVGSEVRNRSALVEGEEVHFQPGSVKASDIVVLAGSPWAAFGGLAA